VQIATVDERRVSRSYPFWEAIPKAAVRMGETLLLFRNQIIGMALGVEEAQVAGVVGIAQVTGEVARAGWMPTLELIALLSLNLAIINILPIPALDGGRLLFVFLEWVRRGKRVSPEREGLVHAVGFAMLITLMVIISYFDVLRIIRGESLLR
jgi:regulator of sigma E protease